MRVIVLIVLALIFGVPLIRRLLVSRFAMKLMAPVLPRLGETERIAQLEAGTVWWDAELFSGLPHWEKLLDFAATAHRRASKRFMDSVRSPNCARCSATTGRSTSCVTCRQERVGLHEGRKVFLWLWIIPKEYGGHWIFACEGKRTRGVRHLRKTVHAPVKRGGP